MELASKVRSYVRPCICTNSQVKPQERFSSVPGSETSRTVEFLVGTIAKRTVCDLAR